MKAVHFRDAERLIDVYGAHARLRTLDAIQLAVAMELQRLGLAETFVCADKVLCQVAETVGFSVLNPEVGSHQ